MDLLEDVQSRARAAADRARRSRRRVAPSAVVASNPDLARLEASVARLEAVTSALLVLVARLERLGDSPLVVAEATLRELQSQAEVADEARDSA